MTNLDFSISGQTLLLHKHPQLNQSSDKPHPIDLIQMAIKSDEISNKKNDQRNKKYVGKPMTKFIDKLPYIEASDDNAYKYGPALLKPVREALATNHNFKTTNRCRFKKVDQNIAYVNHKPYNFVCLYGIVSGYRLEVLHHQAFIFVLIRNVIGMKNNVPVFVTNHLWIDPSFMECLMSKKSNVDRRIGIGDFVLFAGALQKYQGRIGKRPAIRYSLKNTYISAAGYPVIRNHKFHYGFLYYPHGLHCLYYIKNGHIKLGEQISKQDKDYIRKNHLEVGNYAKLLCARAVVKWDNSNANALDYKITTPQISKSCYSYWTGNTCVEFVPSSSITSQTLISKNETTIHSEATHLLWIRLKNELQDNLYPYLLSIPHFYSK